MADGEDEADEFTFVRRQGRMAWRGRPAEERQRVLVLEEHCAEPVTGCVALDDEGAVEVGQGENRRRRHGCLEGGESRSSFRCPGEPFLAEEGCQGGGDRAEFPDKLAVVPRQAEEAPDRPRRARLRPVGHCLDLGRIHGDTRSGDDVAEVGDRFDPERALGSLDEELMLLERAEDGAHVAKMIGP